MSDDMLVHFSSNSSNQSDQSLPTKIAKLEARMVGKASSTAAQQPGWSSVTSAGKFSGAAEELPEPSTSSDSDDDNGGEFLIQANTHKRQKLQDDNANVFEHVEVVTDERQTSLEASETKVNVDLSRKKSGRGRGSSGSGRGRGSRSNDQSKTQISNPAVLAANGQLENVYHKEGRLKDQFNNDNSASFEEEVASLRAKVVSLEEELRKAKQETAEYQNLCQQFEKELKELKDHEQPMKPKRTKIVSDLLISVSKAERQEARLKVRQDSLRLGNVGVIRAGTVLSETWEDGQALKNLKPSSSSERSTGRSYVPTVVELNNVQQLAQQLSDAHRVMNERQKKFDEELQEMREQQRLNYEKQRLNYEKLYERWQQLMDNMSQHLMSFMPSSSSSSSSSSFYPPYQMQPYGGAFQPYSGVFQPSFQSPYGQSYSGFNSQPQQQPLVIAPATPAAAAVQHRAQH